MLQMMLDAVYIDVAIKEVVALRLKAAFLPLFNLHEPVKTGELGHSNTLIDGALNSPSSPRPSASN